MSFALRLHDEPAPASFATPNVPRWYVMTRTACLERERGQQPRTKDPRGIKYIFREVFR